MLELTFTWKAIFSDGSILEQYENEIEHKFKEVQENPNKLINFSLVNKDYSQCFTVDLQKGFILYNNYKNINLEIENKENIRLIFFRCHRVEITEQMMEKSHTIEYHLGMQWQDFEKRNHKIIFQIDEEGNFILENR